MSPESGGRVDDDRLKGKACRFFVVDDLARPPREAEAATATATGAATAGAGTTAAVADAAAVGSATETATATAAEPAAAVADGVSMAAAEVKAGAGSNKWWLPCKRLGCSPEIWCYVSGARPAAQVRSGWLARTRKGGMSPRRAQIELTARCA